jgi:N-hydroxyarylamine O-acetyltransferase
LDEDDLVDKIVRRRRGGFCYELNGAFAALLTALGFLVTHHPAQVFDQDGRLSIPFDHLALVVDLAGERWVADVGFGKHSRHPLRLDRSEAQHDPDGEFRIMPAADGDVDVLRDDTPQYRVDLRRRSLDDFTVASWWHQTSPGSHFTRSLTCSLVTPEGRVTLSGNHLITTTGRARTETVLPGDEAIRNVYRTIFGFELDQLPTVPPSPARAASS